MINYTPLYNKLKSLGLSNWVEKLKKDIPNIFSVKGHGDLKEWIALVEQLPQIPDPIPDFQSDAVSVSTMSTLDAQINQQLTDILKQLHPWRKGPFNILGIKIDAEWRSDLKWNRLKDKISTLTDRLVLDVGCGNGYYGWRMVGAGAQMVIGIEPFLKNVIQYQAIHHFMGEHPFYVLPVGVQDVPENLNLFDTVFSMGVLYHRRSPFDHLFQLKSFMKPGGELILETLVIGGDEGKILVPENRYAKMRNVWFLPSTATLEAWLKRAGFINIRLLDLSKTTIGEQRSTEWMNFESLPDFLDPENPEYTVEGLPAPVRAIFLATKS